MAESKVHSLQEENRQLQNALKEALQEKCEAAQYGLRLLEEKQQLQNQLEDLERRSEEVNRELKLSKQKLYEQNEIQRRLSLAGFQEEQDMLSKYANKEQQLMTQLQDLEVELKDVKLKLERQMADNDGLHQKYTDQMAKCEELEQVNQRLKTELKETKVKEGQLLSEFDDLEAENLDLQKNILALKTSQVEFESLRHEFKRLQEDNEIIHSQLEEITRLKRMTEKSLEEALESLQIERDQRHNLRKELDSRLTSESMYHFTSLRHDLKGSVNLNLTNRDGTPNSSQVLEKMDAALMEKLGPESRSVQEDARLTQSNSVMKGTNGESALSPADDLFTELRVTEMAKYQTELSRMEAEKNELNRLLEEAQRSLELANSEASNKQERINGLLAQLDAIMSVRSEADEEFERKEAENDPSALELTVSGGHNAKDIMAESTLSLLLQVDESESSIRNKDAYKRLRKALRLIENRYSVALRQITSMQHDLWRYHEREKLNSRPELATEEGLKEELIKLQRDLEQRSEEIKSLKGQLSSNEESSRSTDNKLHAFSKDISRALNIHLDSYALVCSAMKENPAKQVTELAERLQIPLRLNHKESPDVSVTSDVNTDDEGDRLVMRLAPADSPNSEVLSNAVDLQLAMANHLRHLLCSFSEKYTQVIKKSTGQVSMDLEEAQREILALKASNEVKREQVAMLRSMLRTNKTTAETALASLKQKYEKEKHIITATMQSLRDELAVLKEESAKNASLRTIYSQRYEEFAAQIDQMQQKLLYAENERRTLNSLLRLAIHQKLDLTQRLEDIEVKQEERGYFQQQQQQQHNPGPRTAIPASYGIPQAQHPVISCANSLLPNPVHPQPYVLGNHPIGGPPFSPPEPSGAGRASAVAAAGGGGGVHQTSGLPVHRTILSPQHATSPNSHSGAKFASSGPDRSKRIPRTKRDGQS